MKPKTINDLYKGAEEAKKELDSFASSLVEKEGITLKVADIKNKKRAQEKLNGKYEGDISKLMDVVRCSFYCDTVEQVEKLGKQIEKQKKVLLKRDRIQTPNERGYRDLKYCIEIKNSQPAEIQIKLNPIEKADEKTHRIYEIIRKTTKDNKNNKMSKADVEKSSKALDTCKRIYWFAVEKYNQKTTGKKLKQHGSDSFIKQLGFAKQR
jgi:hypothetical protein